jgi:hypothetical protein
VCVDSAVLIATSGSISRKKSTGAEMLGQGVGVCRRRRNVGLKKQYDEQAREKPLRNAARVAQIRKAFLGTSGLICLCSECRRAVARQRL